MQIDKLQIDNFIDSIIPDICTQHTGESCGSTIYETGTRIGTVFLGAFAYKKINHLPWVTAAISGIGTKYKVAGGLLTALWVAKPLLGKLAINFLFPHPIEDISIAANVLPHDYDRPEVCNTPGMENECRSDMLLDGSVHLVSTYGYGLLNAIHRRSTQYVSSGLNKYGNQVKSTTHNTIQRTKTIASSLLPKAYRAVGQPGFVDLSIMNLFKQSFANLKATVDYAKNTFAVSRVDSEAHQRIIAKHSNYSGENLAIAAIGLSALAAGAYFLYNKFKAQDLPIDKIDAVSISETEKRPTSEN